MFNNFDGFFGPTSTAAEIESATTTFGIALLMFLSQKEVMVILALLLGLLRLTYEALRLWHYLSDRRKEKRDGEG